MCSAEPMNDDMTPNGSPMQGIPEKSPELKGISDELCPHQGYI